MGRLTRHFKIMYSLEIGWSNFLSFPFYLPVILHLLSLLYPFPHSTFLPFFTYFCTDMLSQIKAFTLFLLLFSSLKQVNHIVWWHQLSSDGYFRTGGPVAVLKPKKQRHYMLGFCISQICPNQGINLQIRFYLPSRVALMINTVNIWKSTWLYCYKC